MIRVAIALCIVLVNEPSAANQLEITYRSYQSCWAFAFLETGKFPETVSVYQKDVKPESKLVEENARRGAIWTNRSFFTRGQAAILFEKIYSRPATNSDLREDGLKWVEALKRASPEQLDAVASNCLSIFLTADSFCKANKCLVSSSIYN